MTTGRRTLIWAAATLVSALLILFPAGGQAFGESSADLSITQTATTATGDAIDATHRLFAGQIVAYTVTITNEGPADADSVTLTETASDSLDAATLQSCDPVAADCAVLTNFGAYTSGTPIVLGTIKAGASRDMMFRAEVTSASLPGDITNTASVTSTVADPDTVDNTDVLLATPVATLADLSVSQFAKNPDGNAIDATNKIRPGEVITYVATVKNAGPSDAQSVRIKSTLDSSLTNAQACTAASCSGDSAFESYSSGTLLRLGDLAAGSTRRVSFRGTVPSTLAPRTEIANVVSVKSYKTETLGATPDSDTADEIATITTTVARALSVGTTSTPAAGTPSSTNNPVSQVSSLPTTGVYFGPVGPATYFQPRPRIRTVVVRKVYYTSAFGRRIASEPPTAVLQTATPTLVAPVARRIVRAPEEVWLLLPIGLILIVWITYLVLEPYEEEQLSLVS